MDLSALTEQPPMSNGNDNMSEVDRLASLMEPGGTEASFNKVATRVSSLLELLGKHDSLAIVCHNDPDPDCLASALALQDIAKKVGIERSEMYHGGTIAHQQSRAMVNLLSIPIRPYHDDARNRSDLLALVDHATLGRNNELSPEAAVDIIIDHHSANDITGRYVDHQPNAGATATIFSEYLRVLDHPLGSRVATALLFGIQRETLGFVDGVTRAEFTAARYLYPKADGSVLRKLTNSLFTGTTLDAIGRAILNRRVRGSCLVTFAGQTSEQDALPQAADYLLNLEGVSTTVVFALIDDSIHLSARTRNSHIHIGETMADAFDDEGSAGGHREMAGGVIPLGPFVPNVGEDGTADQIVTETIHARTFDALSEWC